MPAHNILVLYMITDEKGYASAKIGRGVGGKAYQGEARME